MINTSPTPLSDGEQAPDPEIEFGIFGTEAFTFLCRLPRARGHADGNIYRRMSRNPSERHLSRFWRDPEATEEAKKKKQARSKKVELFLQSFVVSCAWKPGFPGWLSAEPGTALGKTFTSFL